MASTNTHGTFDKEADAVHSSWEDLPKAVNAGGGLLTTYPVWGTVCDGPVAVGNASEQHGTFKIMCHATKIKLIDRKDELNLPLTFYVNVIILPTNHMFPKLYTVVVGNLRATAEQGWFPFDRKLLGYAGQTGLPTWILQ